MTDMQRIVLSVSNLTLRCAVLALGLATAVGAAPAERPRLDVHRVGEYAAIPWQRPGSTIEPGSRADRVRDLNFSVASVNLKDDLPEAFYEDWNEQVKLAAATGNALLPRVHFWDGEDRFKGPMRDVDVYWRRLDRFLARVDVKLLPGIVLAEENVFYGGRPEVLAELYRRTKQNYDVPVWQWWSPMTAVPGSGGWIPSDGWVIDLYFMPKPTFRRHVRKYLIAGVPLVVMPWAAQMDPNTTLSAGQWQANRDQLDVAVEFNLPVAFFWVQGVGCHFGGNRDEPKTEMDKINHWVWDHIERVRRLPEDYQGLPSADTAEGDTLEIGPDRQGKFVYADDFATSRCVDDATMTGFCDLILDGKQLSARGFRGRAVDVTLSYHFAGEFRVGHPTVSLTTTLAAGLAGRVEIDVSADGKQPGPSSASSTTTTGDDAGAKTLVCSTRNNPRLASLDEFWVRIHFSGKPGSNAAPSVRIDDLRIEADVVPRDDPAVTLRATGNDAGQLSYEDSFKTQKYLFTTTRANDSHLEWAEGQIAVRLRPGGSKPELVWKVRAEKPVQNVRVRVEGKANRTNLGTNHYLDVSLDGKHWLHAANTLGQPVDVNGWTTDSLALDLSGDPRFRGIREFFVRLRMEAQSHKEVHPSLSGVIRDLRIDARTLATTNRGPTP